MKKYNLIITENAINEMRVINEYIKNTFNDPINADRVSERILAKCNKLKSFPEANRVRMQLDGNNLRFTHCGKYTIIYYIDDNNSTIMVRNVMYSRRNIPSNLK